jgi:hypothetical protein
MHCRDLETSISLERDFIVWREAKLAYSRALGRGQLLSGAREDGLSLELSSGPFITLVGNRRFQVLSSLPIAVAVT